MLPLKRMSPFTYSIWGISNKPEDDRIPRSTRILIPQGESNLMQMSFIRSAEAAHLYCPLQEEGGTEGEGELGVPHDEGSHHEQGHTGTHCEGHIVRDTL